MLKVRVIPTLLWKNYGLVKGKQFNSWRRIGALTPAVRVFSSRDVDELAIFDVGASLNGSGFDLDMLVEAASVCNVPLSVGGGIRSVDDARVLLLHGADKVIFNSAVYDNLALVTEVANRFGSQCAVVSIDVMSDPSIGYRCLSHSGTVNTGLEFRTWARAVEDAGAGELLVTSIERDGTMQGYDLTLIEMASKTVKIPVIASGGAGDYRHLIEAVHCGASAVAAASMFMFSEQTPHGARDAMRAAGIPVRKVALGA